jgi:hypothetical protein
MTVPGVAVAAGLVAATGGARPTGSTVTDALLLGLVGAACALCAVHARSVPLYLAGAVAALLQPHPAPLILGILAMAAVLVRPHDLGGAPVAAAGGGLLWCCAIGAFGQPGARLLWLPVLFVGVMLLSARMGAPRRFRRRFDLVAIGAVGLAVAGTALAATSVLGARDPIDRGADLLSQGLTAARSGDTERALNQLQAARRAFTSGHDSLASPFAKLGRVVPGLSQNIRALERTSAQARDLAAVGVQAARDADVETLKASNGSIDLAAVRKVEPPLMQVLAQLRTARSAIDDVEDQWLLPMVRDKLDEAHADIVDALPSAELALQAVRAAPDLLGGDGPRTYLVLFTTPAEARSVTGFPGNFGELTFDQGHFSLSRFGRALDINAALPEGGASLTGLDEYLDRYSRFGVTREWRNIPMSPDFPTVADAAAQVYEQGGGRKVDGVLSLDPSALAALLQLTGPISVPDVPEPLDNTNAERFLLLDQYVRFTSNGNNALRIDALEELAQRTIRKLTSIQLPGPRALGDLLGPVVDGKHLQLFAFDEPGQRLFDRLGISGRVPALKGSTVEGYDRDFAMVSTTDAGGSKIDVFQHRNLDYRVAWDPDTGAIEATASITITNDAPASGLPDYVIGNSLGTRLGDGELGTGWSYSFVTLYTPWQPDRAILDGEEIALQQETELGRLAVSTFVAVPPGGSATLTIHLTGLLTADEYRLDLGSQPLVDPEQANVDITIRGASDVASRGPVRARTGGASGTFPLVSDTFVTVRPR